MHPKKRVPYTRDLMSTHFALHCSFGIDHLVGIWSFTWLLSHNTLGVTIEQLSFLVFFVSISLKYSVSLLRLKWSIHPRLSFVVLHNLLNRGLSLWLLLSYILFLNQAVLPRRWRNKHNAFLKCIIWFYFFAIDDIQRSTTLQHLKLWTVYGNLYVVFRMCELYFLKAKCWFDVRAYRTCYSMADQI